MRPKVEKSLTIIFPCLNEEKTIASVLRSAKEKLASMSLQASLLVVNNGSTDQSAAIAKAEGARVVFHKRRGYGEAIRAGIMSANSDYAVMLDADESYDLDQLPLFLQELNTGADIVVGNRFRGEIQKGAMPLSHRHIGNPALSFLARTLFPCNVGDFHCGLRAFNLASIRGLNLQSSGMELASEMLIKAQLRGLKMSEIPVKLSTDGRGRRSHLRPIRDGFRHLKTILQLYADRSSLREPCSPDEEVARYDQSA